MIVAESVSLTYFINAPDVTPAVAPDIALAVTPLLSLGLFTVVSSRGIIRVRVSIGDCQAHVSSLLEGCSILLETVKVEAY